MLSDDELTPMTFDELAEIGDVMRMSEEQLLTELATAGITPERIEAFRLKILKMIEDKKKELGMI